MLQSQKQTTFLIVYNLLCIFWALMKNTLLILALFIRYFHTHWDHPHDHNQSHNHNLSCNHFPEHSRFKITLQNILVHHSWQVEWSSHPYPERWIPVNLQATAENSSLSTLLDFILNFPPKKNLYLFLLLLACTYLNNAWDVVLQALPPSVCLFKMNRFMYSPIVTRFG